MREFWEGKKVLVTGHTGFVGAWLTTALSFFGAHVTGFSLVEDKYSLYEKIKNSLDIRNVYGDLRDGNAIESCIKFCQPDILFHNAAYGFVKECYADPVRAYATNVTGTMNLLQAVRKLKNPCRIIVASSDKVYENSDKEMYLFAESDSLGGADPYSASKTCEDILARSFYDSYLGESGHTMCAVRPSNILGGGDHNRTRLIPSIYRKLGKGKKPVIRNPVSIRPWQNIHDINDAYLTIARKLENGCQVYNVGPEPKGIKSVGEIADYVAGLYGEKDVDKNRAPTIDRKEKAYLGISIEKIKRELGWRPKRSLEQTLGEVYEFYQKDNGANTYQLCIEQIKNYYKHTEDHNAKLEQ